MLAAQSGHEQVALVLLEAGASLKVVSISNFTMLMAASLGGLTTVLKRVLPQNWTSTLLSSPRMGQRQATLRSCMQRRRASSTASTCCSALARARKCRLLQARPRFRHTVVCDLLGAL